MSPKSRLRNGEIPCAKQSGKAAPPYRSAGTGGYENQNRSLCAALPSVRRTTDRYRSTRVLNRTLFWTTADLETKLVDFQHYYDGHRTHAGLDGRPPEPPLRIRQGQVSQLMTSTPDEHSRPADPFVLVRRRTLRGRLPSGTSSRSIESPIDAQIDLCRRRPG